MVPNHAALDPFLTYAWLDLHRGIAPENCGARRSWDTEKYSHGAMARGKSSFQTPHEG